MAVVSFLRPLDQPPGKRRLLADLKDSLQDKRFDCFRLIVAYAKSGPFNRMRADLQKWRSLGSKTEAIIGIDQRGTSYEALGLALDLCDDVYVTQESGITFHPKIYFFRGATVARAFVGSNNLTVGGTETNFESALQVDLDVAKDALTLKELEVAWAELLPASCPATRKLDTQLLEKLVADGDVLPEHAIRSANSDGASGMVPKRSARSGLTLKPASALPKLATAAAPLPPIKASSKKASQAGVVATIQPVARGLAIQIKPHHNGEIFLSVVAARQYPAFFRWPFNGATTPKKLGNPTYPQLVPDPVVSITVYGAGLSPLLTLNSYHLNTIYYEKKSEIRVTASPLVGIVPDYSVMIMEVSATAGIDYDITIHTPASKDYAGWVAACNQEMPSGGKAPRKYGWF